MVFFMANWAVMRRTESALPRIRSRSRGRPAYSVGSGP